MNHLQRSRRIAHVVAWVLLCIGAAAAVVGASTPQNRSDSIVVVAATTAITVASAGLPGGGATSVAPARPSSLNSTGQLARNEAFWSVQKAPLAAARVLRSAKQEAEWVGGFLLAVTAATASTRGRPTGKRHPTNAADRHLPDTTWHLLLERAVPRRSPSRNTSLHQLQTAPSRSTPSQPTGITSPPGATDRHLLDMGRQLLQRQTVHQQNVPHNAGVPLQGRTVRLSCP